MNAKLDKVMSTLLDTRPEVINVGLEGFANDLASQGVGVTQVDWSPPAGGNAELAKVLAELDEAPARERIEKANNEAVSRMLSCDPVLVDVIPASEAIPTLPDGMILHAGPPIEWPAMCGPLRGAVTGIAVFEGWAKDLADAEVKAQAGEFTFHPNHDFDTVGPMTGMTTRSQLLMVVENRAFGNRAYCALNEGLGKVMRFGGNDSEVLDRLGWLRDVFGPAFSAALRHKGGVPLKHLVARGLTMGDEMHQRNVGCSSLLLRELAPAFAATCANTNTLSELFAFIGGNDQFFLNVAMAMGKAIMDPVKGIADSTVVTAMCRNGTEFGIRVSATGERWFTAPVEMPEGLYFPGFSAADANPDIGDSTIVETIGLGGFAMAASPAVAGFVGAGAASEAATFTRSMRGITLSENPEWTIPALDYGGVPTGIDVRRVIELGVPPTINTGIAHKEPGVGQVGAGVVKAPMPCFEAALLAVADQLRRA